MVYTVAMIASTGMFKANAIQFGMDQMLEASSSQLSTFIHWYYFSRSVAIGLLTLIIIGKYCSWHNVSQ